MVNRSLWLGSRWALIAQEGTPHPFRPLIAAAESGAWESDAQCSYHPFQFGHASSDQCNALGGIDVPGRFAAAEPASLCGNEFLGQLGKLSTQHLRETLGLGTFRLLCLGRRVDAGGSA
jgi:hypothetical protein